MGIEKIKNLSNILYKYLNNNNLCDGHLSYVKLGSLNILSTTRFNRYDLSYPSTNGQSNIDAVYSKLKYDISKYQCYIVEDNIEQHNKENTLSIHAKIGRTDVKRSEINDVIFVKTNNEATINGSILNVQLDSDNFHAFRTNFFVGDELWFYILDKDVNDLRLYFMLKRSEAYRDIMQPTMLEKSLAEIQGVEYEKDSYYDEYSYDHLGKNYNEIRKEICVLPEVHGLSFIKEMLESEYIDLSPEFQRNEVWHDINKKSLFIESMLLNIPIPIFYLYSNGNGLEIIDGKQRLTTIKEFFADKFVLTNMKYLKELNGKKYSDLSGKIRMDLGRYQITFYVLDEHTPKYYLFDIFMRINTGGMPLVAQEIRNIFSKPKVRKLYQSMAGSKSFLDCTDRKIKDDRMQAQELALRFIALYKKMDYETDIISFEESSLTKLYENTIIQLNNEGESEYGEYYKRFNQGCSNAKRLLGKNAFVRLKLVGKRIENKSNVINKQLFITFVLLLANPKYEYLEKDLIEFRSSIISELYYVMEHGMLGKYLSSNTTSKENIKILLNCIGSILKECLKNDK